MMKTKINLENRIETELAAAGILNEKAIGFFLYSICQTLPDFKIENEISETNIIRRYIALLPQMEFPFYKSSRQLLVLPSHIILNEVLYSDRDLSMFFIQYARFCLLLEILFEIYPSWFEFLSFPPYRVPAPHTINEGDRLDGMIRQYLRKYEHSVPDKKREELQIHEDKRLYAILTRLSGCYYLPYSTDFTPHNKSIFNAIKEHPASCSPQKHAEN